MIRDVGAGMFVALLGDMHRYTFGLAIMVVTLGLAGTASGATVQVDGGSLQAAIDASADGDVIKVAAGSYAPVVIRGKSIELRGGYTSAFTASDPQANVTEIRGDGSQAAVTIEDAPSVLIDGFHITGGRRGITTTAWPADAFTTRISNNVIYDNHVPGLEEAGGGIYCDNQTVIRGNVIRDNSAGWGGGIAGFVEAASVVIEDNVIEDNIGTGDHGGGIHMAATSLELSGNIIRRNTIGRDAGYGWGGGVIVFGLGTTAELSYNVVYENAAPTAGSGIHIDDEAVATIDHTLVYGNGCTEYGGAGIYVDGLDAGKPSHVEMMNVTVADHDCGGDGNGVFVEQDSQVTITSSIFWNNGDDFFTDSTSRINLRYSLSEEERSGTGNISEDPLFADPAAGDYHLRSALGRWDDGDWVSDDETSPAIGAGAPDDAGDPVNMGAYGGTDEASKGDGESTDPGTDPDEEERARIVSCQAGGGMPGAVVALFVFLAWTRRSRVRG